jgi:hypothetical protein
MSLVQLWYRLSVVTRCDYCIMKYKEKCFLMLCAVYLWNKATACDNGLCLQVKHQFLGAFAKLRKATISFVSLSTYNWAPNRNIFIKFDI